MRAPGATSTGGGVRMRKARNGGVMRSRLAALAKNSNTSSRGRGSQSQVSRPNTRMGTSVAPLGSMDNQQEQTGQGPQEQNPQSNQPPAEDTRNRERSPEDPTRGRQGD